MVVTYGWVMTQIFLVFACLFFAFHLFPDDPTLTMPDAVPPGAISPEEVVDIVMEQELYEKFDKMRILTNIEVTYYPTGNTRHEQLENEFGVSYNLIYRVDVISLTRCFGTTTKIFFLSPEGVVFGTKQLTAC